VLILWRRAGQSLIVGDGIEIQVLDAGSNRVKLGIVAPSSVSVFRKETQTTREQNRAAAASADGKMMSQLLRLTRAGQSAHDNETVK
jgi:carbon storage regulator